ncbi:MAG: hypothetical protein U0360_09590 [Dehalococcoidia bacterium]
MSAVADELFATVEDGWRAADAEIEAEQFFARLTTAGMEWFEVWARKQAPEVMDVSDAISATLHETTAEFVERQTDALTSAQLRTLLLAFEVWTYPDAGDFRGSLEDITRDVVGWLVREPMFESLPNYGRAPWRS